MLFSDAHPRELEIGSGDGLVLTRLARLTPSVNFVGVDVSAAQVASSAQRARKLPNCEFVWSDACDFLRAQRRSAFERLHLYFPTPYSHSATGAYRYLDAEFFDLMLAVLAPGAEIRFVSDHVDLVAGLMNYAQARFCLVLPWTPLDGSSRDGLFVDSRWERKLQTTIAPTAFRVIP